jgi:carboxypeptidase Taq
MQAVEQAHEIMRKVKDLNAVSAVLGWDQETYMPSGGIEARAEHIATIDTLSHEVLTGDTARRTADNLRSGLDTLTGDDKEIMTLFLRDHDRAVKLPDSLVRETSRAQSLAQEGWKKAKSEKNFAIFAPHLERLIGLKIQAAELYGYTENRYDALMDLFEPGMKVSIIKPVFERLRQGTVELLDKVLPLRDSINDEILHKSYEREKQLEFGKSIVNKLGFDFERGRVDLSAHPFCTNFAPTDVRLTTRILENDIRSCLFGLIHEAGHGMYEQGVNMKYFRTFAAEGTSMGIHESQSLFWENVIARTEEFWQWALPQLKTVFPEQLGDTTPRDFYRAINVMRPSFIRIDSDETTYNLHIILRFEIEEAFINEKIRVNDIPELWNEKMRTSLGIVPRNDAEGCLQDVHWSFGGYGYFPSYTLGKLYAAMLWTQLQKEKPEVRNLIASGDFGPILEWLRSNIHQYGRTQMSEEIMQRVTGRGLTETDFLAYVGAKAQDVYNLA